MGVLSRRWWSVGNQQIASDLQPSRLTDRKESFAMSRPSLVRAVYVPVKTRLRRGGALAAAAALIFGGMHLYGASEPFLVKDINPGTQLR